MSGGSYSRPAEQPRPFEVDEQTRDALVAAGWTPPRVVIAYVHKHPVTGALTKFRAAETYVAYYEEPMIKIEPFDEKRRDALLITMPIVPINLQRDRRVHRLGGDGALCGALDALLGTADWRLVDCTGCRRTGEAASA